MFKILTLTALIFITSSSYSYGASYYCEGKSGDTSPEDVFPDVIHLDTKLKDSLGGPVEMGRNIIFAHKIGQTIRQTTLFTKNGKAKVLGLAYGKSRWYRCKEKVGEQELNKTDTVLKANKNNSQLNESQSAHTGVLFRATEKQFQQSQYIKNNYWNSKSKKTFKKLSGTNKLQMWMGPPPCPTISWWSYPTKSQKFINKWELFVLEKLKGFPSETIKQCSIPSDVIINGKMTEHPINTKHYNRATGTMIIKRNNDVTPLKVITEQDYLSERKGGNVYNEALIKVCSFTFISKSKVSVDCNSLGKFDATFRVTNAMKGDYKLIGKNNKFEFLVTNKSLARTKADNPELFRKNWSN
jgi:hypothetical protein